MNINDGNEELSSFEYTAVLRSGARLFKLVLVWKVKIESPEPPSLKCQLRKPSNMLQNCTHSRSFVRWRLYGRK